MGDLPVGPIVSSVQAIEPTRVPLHGNYTSLLRLEPSFAPSLYKHLGGQENASRWTYMMTGGYNTPEEYQAAVNGWSESTDPLFYTVLSAPASDPNAEPLGTLSFMNVVAPQRRIEIGSVIFGEQLKQTRQATEAFYLFIQHAFEDLHYERVEWKANALNAPSLSAAKRLGFSFEGIFRKHLIIKGRRRDTAWFSIIDEEWPPIKTAFVSWLDESNFDEDGTQRKSLQEIRGNIA